MMLEAYKVALFSKDQSTQNGAILYNSYGIELCSACNNFPKNVKQHHFRLKRPLKYKYTEHAERAVIFKAARFGYCTRNTIMVCPFAACSDCARGIALAGVKQLWIHRHVFEFANQKWLEEVDHGHAILREYGVDLKIFEEKLNLDFQIKVNGEYRCL